MGRRMRDGGWLWNIIDRDEGCDCFEVIVVAAWGGKGFRGCSGCTGVYESITVTYDVGEERSIEWGRWCSGKT